MGQVSWTREAELWLRDIFDFIRQDNPDAAARQVADIVERAATLARFPQMGTRYDRIADREVRILVHRPYRIAYLVQDSGDIDILGVFHGALDIKKYLF